MSSASIAEAEVDFSALKSLQDQQSKRDESLSSLLHSASFDDTATASSLGLGKTETFLFSAPKKDKTAEVKALASSAKPVALTSLKEKGLAPLTNTNHDDEVEDDEVEKLAQWSVRALGDSPSPSSIYFPTSTSPHASSSSSSSSSPSSSLSLSSSSESTGPSSSSSSFSLYAQAQQPSQHMFIQPARTMETLPSHSPIAVPKQFMLKSLERLKRVRSDEVVSLLGITFAYLDNDKDGFILKDEAWNHFSSICGQARATMRRLADEARQLQEEEKEKTREKMDSKQQLMLNAFSQYSSDILMVDDDMWASSQLDFKQALDGLKRKKIPFDLWVEMYKEIDVDDMLLAIILEHGIKKMESQ